MVVEVPNEDLFQASVDALVNPVNTHGVMGAGLAREFRLRHPAMFQEYRRICDRGMLDVGQMHFWLTGQLQPRFIVNFPTKRDWREPSRLPWVRAGLEELARQVVLRQIPSIAVPALGCGLGGLDWATVRREVWTMFRPLATEVHLYPPAPTA